MSQHKRASGASEEPDDRLESVTDTEEYDELMQLERLESLEEEMMELGVTTLDEVRQRIADLHRDMDEKGV
jgi:hypothetical protein